MMLNLLLPLGVLTIKNRYLLHNGQVSSKSVSVDVKAIEEFLETINKLVVKEKYLPE